MSYKLVGYTKQNKTKQKEKREEEEEACLHKRASWITRINSTSNFIKKHSTISKRESRRNKRNSKVSHKENTLLHLQII
jgi:hypothetical protein